MNFLDIISIIGWVAAVLQLGQFMIALLRFARSRLRSKNDLENQVAANFQPVSDDGWEALSQRGQDPGASATGVDNIHEPRMRLGPSRLMVTANKEPLLSETDLVAP